MLGHDELYVSVEASHVCKYISDWFNLRIVSMMESFEHFEPLREPYTLTRLSLHGAIGMTARAFQEYTMRCPLLDDAFGMMKTNVSKNTACILHNEIALLQGN